MYPYHPLISHMLSTYKYIICQSKKYLSHFQIFYFFLIIHDVAVNHRVNVEYVTLSTTLICCHAVTLYFIISASHTIKMEVYTTYILYYPDLHYLKGINEILIHFGSPKHELIFNIKFVVYYLYVLHE